MHLFGNTFRFWTQGDLSSFSIIFLKETWSYNSAIGEELFNLRFAASTRALDNPLRLRILKRERARIQTILREDKLGIRGLGIENSATEESGNK